MVRTAGKKSAATAQKNSTRGSLPLKRNQVAAPVVKIKAPDNKAKK